MPSCHRGPVCPMIGESANSQIMLLAAAIAEGTAVAKWASSNEVPERTASDGPPSRPWGRKDKHCRRRKDTDFYSSKELWIVLLVPSRYGFTAREGPTAMSMRVKAAAGKAKSPWAA